IYLLRCLTHSFFISAHPDHRDLHSFPTRRSSDLRSPSSTGDSAESTPSTWRSTSTSPSSAGGSRTRSQASCPRELGDGCSDLDRSEEHTSELQSRGHLVCRLLLEKKKCGFRDRHR